MRKRILSQAKQKYFDTEEQALEYVGKILRKDKAWLKAKRRRHYAVRGAFVTLLVAGEIVIGATILSIAAGVGVKVKNAVSEQTKKRKSAKV